jgi:hypothetical protein
MSSPVAILACPFCARDHGAVMHGGVSIWVECRSCGGSGKSCTTEDAAIAWWNVRAGRGYSEDICPGHVASDGDPKICGLCGVHVDSLRPDCMVTEETSDA